MKRAGFVLVAACLLLSACGALPFRPAPTVTVVPTPTPTVTISVTPKPTPTVTATVTKAVPKAKPLTESYCGTIDGYRVSVLGSTSCPFALNVADAYATMGGPSVSAWSPVTMRWYTMNCTGYPVYCTGGVAAKVRLR